MTAHVPFRATAPLPPGKLLLEASAGTGKTYTIASLVLRAIAELEVDLERILVVTFTRAAAAELRSRVRERVRAAATVLDRAHRSARDAGAVDVEQLAGDDEILTHLLHPADVPTLARRAHRLRVAAERFDEATIDTIHGFCQAALHRAAPDVPIDLGAELAEDVGDLLDETVHDALIRELRSADEAWYRLAVGHGVGPERLRLIADHLDREPFLEVTPARGEHSEPPGTTWARALDRFLGAWWQQHAELAAWLEEHVDDPMYAGRNLAKRVEQVTAWCRSAPEDPPSASDTTALTWFTRDRIGQRHDGEPPLPSHLDVVEAAHDLLRLPSELVTRSLVAFADDLRTQIPRRKADRGILSFGDLLIRLEQALDDEATAGAVRRGIRDRYDMALIDEFQDTDPVQWRIFQRIFDGEARLHLIGDPKQAIYAFRGADVGTYLAAAAAVPDERRFTLPTNHRSDASYLEALRQLFDRDERFGATGYFAVQDIPFVPVVAADRHREDRVRAPDGPRPALRLRFVPRSLGATDDGDPPAELPKTWAGAFLPRLVVDEVLDLLEEAAEIRDDGTWRSVAPRDLAVLVRSNRQARRMQTALLDAGVPAVLESDESVFASPEATALQRLFDALLRPSSERAARPALIGPILGVEPAILDAADDAAWDGWTEDLVRWAQRWRQHGIAVALQQILAERRTAPRVLTHPRGERMVTNLAHLRELLHTAEQSQRLGPDGLAAWLREQRHDPASRVEERELRLESDADAVTVATVHRAKGLQYGIVWCPFLWDGKGLPSGDVDVLRYRDPVTRELRLDLTVDREAKGPVRRIAERQSWEEDLRLLYVALTRAEHAAIVHTGAFGDFGGSALFRLLHGGGLDVDGAPDRRRHRALTDGRLRADLESLAGTAIAVSDASQPVAGRRWRAPVTDDRELVVRSFDRELDTSWQRTSFSRLAAGELGPPAGTPQDDGRDHDHQAAPADPDLQPDVGGPTRATTMLLADVPRGPAAGTFLHLVLEHLDLSADDTQIRSAIEAQLRVTPLVGVDVATLASGLRAVLSTPLGPWLDEHHLGELSRANRLDELDFDLPIGGGYRAQGEPLDLTRLAEVFEAHDALSPLPLARAARRLRAHRTPPVRGFLTGSIDLVARFDGRYVVADYKSNWLGSPTEPDLDAYAPAALADAMVHGDYLLQASLYLVALHRFLRSRLAGYDYDTHIGGFAYLFLRGMVGPRTPRDREGAPFGVYAHRPDRRFVEDLDRVLQGVAA